MKTKTQVLLELNSKTLGFVFNKTNNATLVSSNKNRVRIAEIEDKYVHVRINGELYCYKIAGGHIVDNGYREEFLRNYKYLRVITYWDSFEEAKASECGDYIVSRKNRKEEAGFERLYNEIAIKPHVGRATSKDRTPELCDTHACVKYLEGFKHSYMEITAEVMRVSDIATCALVLSIAALAIGILTIVLNV